LRILQLESRLLGQRIRQARERLGMTQEILAERAGKDQRAISEYENGKRRLSAVDLPMFARALEVSLLYFFDGETSPKDDDAALLEEFSRLPTPQAKQSAIELVRVFSDAITAHIPS
jgi:transcriptional regulator with XRE-family HTH domain